MHCLLMYGIACLTTSASKLTSIVVPAYSKKVETQSEHGSPHRPCS